MDDQLKEKMIFSVILVSVLVALYILYRILRFVQYALKLDPLTFLGVLITALVAIGGVYSYARSRLDKQIERLDEIRIWLLYPWMRTSSASGDLRSIYTQDDDLQGIAKHAADKLVEARAAVAGRIASKPLRLIVREKEEKVNVLEGIDETAALLHTFSVTRFQSDKELTEQWKNVCDKTNTIYIAVTALENQRFKMRHYVPRWSSNLLTRFVSRLRDS